MPKGPPFQFAPKSGWRPVPRPMPAIRLAEFGSTGEVSTGVFQGSVEGNICLPFRLAPIPRSGTPVVPPVVVVLLVVVELVVPVVEVLVVEPVVWPPFFPVGLAM